MTDDLICCCYRSQYTPSNSPPIGKHLSLDNATPESSPSDNALGQTGTVPSLETSAGRAESGELGLKALNLCYPAKLETAHSHSFLTKGE